MSQGMQVAILLSVLSAASYAAAAVLQEYLAVAGHRSAPRWLLMLGLTGAGAGLHVVALRFGTVGVVQALGASTLLLALPIAALRSRTRVSPAAWRDAGLTVVGLAGLLALTLPPDTSVMLTDVQGKCLSMTTVVGVAVLACVARLVSSPLLRSLSYAAASGTAFGVASVLVKTQTVDLTALVWPALIVIALLAGAGLLFGQLSYRGAGLAAPLATVSVTNPLVATTVGVLLLGEGFRFGATGLVLAVVAGAVAARGVVGLAVHSAVVEPTPVEPPVREPAMAAPDVCTAP
jgi:hypothetical protein